MVVAARHENGGHRAVAFDQDVVACHSETPPEFLLLGTLHAMNRRIETRLAAQRVIDDGDMLLFRALPAPDRVSVDPSSSSTTTGTAAGVVSATGRLARRHRSAELAEVRVFYQRRQVCDQLLAQHSARQS
jgi:hypothetical protein